MVCLTLILKEQMNVVLVSKYWKKHLRKCHFGTNGCVVCGNKGHMLNKESKNFFDVFTVPIPLNYCHFYALWSRVDKGALSYEGTGM